MREVKNLCFNEWELKKWLWETGRQKQMIENIKEEIAELRQQQLFLRELEGKGWQDMPKGSGGGDGIGMRIVRISEIEEMIAKELLPKLKKLLQRQRQMKKMLFWQSSEGRRMYNDLYAVFAGEKLECNFQRTV